MSQSEPTTEQHTQQIAEEKPPEEQKELFLQPEPINEEPLDDTTPKLHVLIRCDLGMTKGKICAQAAHAVLGLYKDLMERQPMEFSLWASVGFPQETYQANSAEDLYSTERMAKQFDLMGYVVHDAGRTQIAAMSATVCAVGPATCAQVKGLLQDRGFKKLE
ncbi:hypothetical protein FGO68_gene9946 [Halteria grandinella]|uniref:peptidyl-tRNA hydrolase n=1 Tax=Halteria grandinella TaxID=5974 RepID=A0A8J8NSD0_HALGN|nr:hypothetical protein FGO68_gene9946 [Halteria grandinella]